MSGIAENPSFLKEKHLVPQFLLYFCVFAFGSNKNVQWGGKENRSSLSCPSLLRFKRRLFFLGSLVRFVEHAEQVSGFQSFLFLAFNVEDYMAHIEHDEAIAIG